MEHSTSLLNFYVSNTLDIFYEATDQSNFLKTLLIIYFDFFSKDMFSKFELPNSKCGLSALVAYLLVFTVCCI